MSSKAKLCMYVHRHVRVCCILRFSMIRTIVMKLFHVTYGHYFRKVLGMYRLLGPYWINKE